MNSTTDDFPPFPEGIPTSPIAKISHSLLLASDPTESARVLRACSTDGFFYLDMTTSAPGNQLLSESESLHTLSKETFTMPLEEKRKYANEKGKSLFGSKEAGTVKKTDTALKPDTTKFFKAAKDHVHGVAESRTYPPELMAVKPLIQSFTKGAHECGMLVLRILARQMGLGEEEFTNKNIFEHPSGDHMRLTHKIPHETDKNAIGLPSHTDFGSITILFNWLGGLQIQSHDPEKQGEWAYVKPLPGHAIINLGDAMVKFTNGALKSAKHRVVPAPGDQVNFDRYSIVYFVRPADDVLMEPVEKLRGERVVQVGGKVGEEKVYTAGEWMVRRLVQLGS